MSRRDICNETHIGMDVPFDIARPFIERRLMRRCSKTENGCWEWTGFLMPLGYGDITVQGKGWRVHPLAYKVFKGDFDESLDVCHSCDNRACFNPDHLWLGTHMDNMVDHIKKGRHFEREQTHCWRGHPLSGENLYIAPSGMRNCRECARIRRSREYVPRISRKITKAS